MNSEPPPGVYDDDEIPDFEWESFRGPGRGKLRVTETSCCGHFEWASQGGQFLVLSDLGRRETGRGSYDQARAIWDHLIVGHARWHAETRDKGARSTARVPAFRRQRS